MLPSEKYNLLEADRKPYEDRAEEISGLTLPYLYRSSSDSSVSETRYTTSQSFNGKLVNTLKAKIGMSLLPPSTSSFRFKPNPEALEELFQGNESAIAELSKELSVKEDMINSELEVQQIRSDLFDVVAQLIVVGSVVVEKIEKAGIQIRPLNSFVVENDDRGVPYTIVVKEKLAFPPEGYTGVEKEFYELYTMCAYDSETKKWTMTQDVEGDEVGQEKTYTDENLPFKYLGWTWNVGDKYHRPFAEDYAKDLQQVDILSRLNTEGAVVSAKVNLFVDQRGGRTRKKDVANSKNGDVLDGRADDVTALQLQKNHDFNVTNQREMEIKRNLKECFLDNGSVTRDAERVTAAEIRIMAQQLESSTLAGIYSKMSLQWSKWVITMIMNELGIKFKEIDVSILTGLDALGRNQESQKLDGYIQRMAGMNLMHWIKESELVRRYAMLEGIDQTSLIKTPDEVQQELEQQRQQQQQAMMAESGAQELGRAGANKLVEGQ